VEQHVPEVVYDYLHVVVDIGKSASEHAQLYEHWEGREGATGKEKIYLKN